MNDSLPLEVKGITIHNTGTTESASELRDKMKKSGQLYLSSKVLISLTAFLCALRYKEKSL